MGFGYKGKRKKVVGNRKKDVKILENINITEDLVILKYFWCSFEQLKLVENGAIFGGNIQHSVAH